MDKNKIIIALLTAIGATLFAWMILDIGLNEIINIVKRLHWWQLGLITLTFFAFLATTTLAFRKILKALGYNLSFKYLYLIQCVKFTVGYITPFLNAGGEPVLVYLLLKRNRIPISQSTSVAIIERVMRATQGLIFITIGLLVTILTVPMKWWSYPILLTIFVFLCWLLWAYYAKSLDGTGFFKYITKQLRLTKWKFFSHPHNAHVISNIDQTTSKFIKEHPLEFWNAFCYSMGSTVVMILQVYFVILFLGWTPNILTIVIIYATINAIALVPIPAALGTYEASTATVFATQGFGAGSGLVFSLVIRVANIIAIIPGLLLLPYFGLTIRKIVTKNKTNMDMEQLITLKYNGRKSSLKS